MAKIKELRERIPAPTIVRRERNGNFDPLNYAYDQLPTFLVCQKLDFDFKNLPDELDEIYGDDVEIRHRHNLILSLKMDFLPMLTQMIRASCSQRFLAELHQMGLAHVMFASIA